MTRLLLDRIEGRDDLPRRTVLPVELVLRDDRVSYRLTPSGCRNWSLTAVTPPHHPERERS